MQRKRIIDIIKVIGKQGLTYRGKRNERASELTKSDIHQGNFLEIVKLVAKYDFVLRCHINKVSEQSQKQKDKRHNTAQATKYHGRGSLVTFLSNDT